MPDYTDTFLYKEKIRQALIKTTGLFSANAQMNGSCMNRNNEYVNPNYCLNDDCTEENIFEGFRKSALDYFELKKIKWHKPEETKVPLNKPDNHLCCSQSFCINTLFYFIDKPKELNNLLNLMGFPSKEVLPFELDKPFDKNKPSYVCFEWFGATNYLQELHYWTVISDDIRSRGEGCTNADFAIRFKDKSDKIQILIGEWKYTESYSTMENNYRHFAVRKHRLNYIYYKTLDVAIYPIVSPTKDVLDLFLDPLYQLLRLQLLAQQMQVNNEMGTEKVTLLLTVPKANIDYKESFHTDRMKFYKDIGVMNFWENTVGKEYFKYIYTEDLLKYINETVGQNKYTNYLKTRYKWYN